ncbi:MAG TPA: hypothetical protein VFU02_07195 [Polyangiaceae bacterium]|nr:hypothetical protein [Polyangiaceae bacterium]
MERWRDSGLTSAEFAAEIDINPRTLTYWAWRVRKDGKQRQPEVRQALPETPKATPQRKRTEKSPQPPSFVELVSASPTDSQPLEIVVRSVTVRVPQTAAAELVKRAFEFAEKQK